jgi:REP element-mobilizing transposase RayT
MILGGWWVNHWEWLAEKYCRVLLDEYVVMPNHLHGIIVITDRTTDVMQRAPEKPAFLERKPIGRLIGAFKTLSTSQINQSLATSGNQLWQRDFWEHVIRNEHELNLIRASVRNNPAQWFNDSLKVKPGGGHICLRSEILWWYPQLELSLIGAVREPPQCLCQMAGTKSTGPECVIIWGEDRIERLGRFTNRPYMPRNNTDMLVRSPTPSK